MKKTYKYSYFTVFDKGSVNFNTYFNGKQAYRIYTDENERRTDIPIVILQVKNIDNYYIVEAMDEVDFKAMFSVSEDKRKGYYVID